MMQLKELANPREPFPSPDSWRTPAFALGILLCLLAFALWFRGRPKLAKKQRKRNPKEEELARLLQLELQAKADLGVQDLHLLASDLGSLLRYHYQRKTQQPCLGLTQAQLIKLISASSQKNAKTLSPLLARWEAVIYAQRPWDPEQRIDDIQTLKHFLQNPQGEQS